MDLYGFFTPPNLRFKRYSYSITVLKNKKNIASNYNAWTC